MATGVAKPKAHGQEITRTEIALSKAYDKSLPANSHPIMTTIEITMTHGTNIPDTLSAIRAIGAFVLEASETI